MGPAGARRSQGWGVSYTSGVTAEFCVCGVGFVLAAKGSGASPCCSFKLFLNAPSCELRNFPTCATNE